MEEKLYRQHVTVIAVGLVAGIAAAYAFLSLPFDFSATLAQAARLGIVSRTIADGYPEQYDVYNYAAVVGFPILLATVGWLIWARGDQRQGLRGLLVPEPDAQPTGTGGRLLLLGIACFYFVVSFACFRSAAYNNAASLIPWYLLIEEGQHLAWVQAILGGSLYGRDFHCLFGPLMIYPLAWFMKLAGISVASLRAYTYLLNLAAYLVVLCFLYKTLRSKAALVAFAAIYLWIFSPLTVFFPNASYLRVALGLLPILLAYLYLEKRHRWLLVLSGLSLGASVLFSQEVGICSAIAVVALLLVYHLPARGDKTVCTVLALVAAGLAAATLPVLAYFQLQGAVEDIVHNLLLQPSLQTLGYSGLPFPSLRILLHDPTNRSLWFFYAPIVVYLFSAARLLPVVLLNCRDRQTVLRLSLLIFGMLLFRSALGRSDVPHVSFAMPPAVLLVFLHIDDVFSGPPKTLALQKVIAAAGVAGGALVLALVCVDNMYFDLWRNLKADADRQGGGLMTAALGRTDAGLARAGVPLHPKLQEDLVDIRRFLDVNTRPGAYVYFFPNHGALYFLCNRNNPTKFAHAFYAATSDQRQELIADLEQKKPGFVVYDVNAYKIDDFTAEQYAPEVVGYIQSYYRPVARNDNYLFLKRMAR